MALEERRDDTAAPIRTAQNPTKKTPFSNRTPGCTGKSSVSCFSNSFSQCSFPPSSLDTVFSFVSAHGGLRRGRSRNREPQHRIRAWHPPSGHRRRPSPRRVGTVYTSASYRERASEGRYVAHLVEAAGHMREPGGHVRVGQHHGVPRRLARAVRAQDGRGESRNHSAMPARGRTPPPTVFCRRARCGSIQ